MELKTTTEAGLKVLFTRVTEAFDSVLEFCNKMVEETKNALLDGNAEVDVDEPGNKVFEEGSEVADFPICGEKVVRRFRVVMDSFADSITAIDIFCVGDDLIIFDVEFPKTPLALFDVTMLVNFKLVTTGEAVKDERRTSVDGTFGCKGAELGKFLLTVDMLVITELDQSKAGLDERNKGVDNISVELLNGLVARELVLVTRVGIVGTIMLVTIGTILVVGCISVVAVLSRTLVLFIASNPEDRFFTTVDSKRELEIGDNEARLLTIFIELV